MTDNDLNASNEEKLFRSFEEVCAVLLQAMAPVMKVTYEPWQNQTANVEIAWA